MNQRYRKHLPLLLFAVVRCVLWAPLIQAEASGPASDNSQPINLAVFIDGQVSVKRQGWKSDVPVVFGTRLQPGDLLTLAPSSHAKVVCSDLTLHDIPTGRSGVPCPTSKPLLRWTDGSMINVTRSKPSSGSLMVLSPRRTKLMSPNPILRWTPVSGATGYLVGVRGANLGWSEEVGSVTQIAYPDSAPQLKAGVDYKLIVETNGQRSDNEPGQGLGFSVLITKDRKAVEKEQKRIRELGLVEGATQFLVAYLYAEHDLNAEAIQRLESVSQTFKAAAVARLLGDLYLNVGLTRQAETSYLNSLTLSKDEKDEEGDMLTHLTLARIYAKALGNKDSAIQNLNAALALAEKIGDDLTASQAKERLAELKKTGM